MLKPLYFVSIRYLYLKYHVTHVTFTIAPKTLARVLQSQYHSLMLLQGSFSCMFTLLANVIFARVCKKWLTKSKWQKKKLFISLKQGII
ncbi:hypothetical protein BpHYR1_014718 [Brachionus plicatilis]|uniref:Uncharacterized protein n=1 Tax=Brachionus plicatilis TaxID=10195 RepID=A0A3M7RJR6_BRAPC|nr:hypothetical protein BpHYR1_014718 [Brachionus plicatilis]